MSVSLLIFDALITKLNNALLHFAVAHLITYFNNLLLHFLISKRKQIITKGDKRRYNFQQLRNGAACCCCFFFLYINACFYRN